MNNRSAGLDLRYEHDGPRSFPGCLEDRGIGTVGRGHVTHHEALGPDFTRVISFDFIFYFYLVKFN